MWTNGVGAPNPTSGGAVLNRFRLELYPSVTASTTNMGWKLLIDQNLTGTFLPPVSGSNLTFVNNVIPLGFASYAVDATFTENPRSVSVFTGPSPDSQTVSVGSPVTVGVTVKGWNPAFQWRKNGIPIPNATNRTYTLPSATLADNGAQFDVVVSNLSDPANVVTSAVATVTIRTPNNLTWHPTVDFTTWSTTVNNWTTNGGTTQTRFTAGDNATFDSLGYSIGANSGSTVTLNDAINANGVTVNVINSQSYQWTGSGSLKGQNLHLTGDGTGTLGLQTAASFATAAIDDRSTLDVGSGGVDGSFQANITTNNGTINFNNASGILTIPGRLAGSGSVYQNGSGQTVLSATNSVYSIGSINAGSLAIASVPFGDIANNAELQPSGPLDMVFTNAMSGIGRIYFSGFQKTTLTGVSTYTGINQIYWSEVTVDNPAALGDTSAGASFVSGGERLGGLYLSNNITWVQPLTLGAKVLASAAATIPHLGNRGGNNTVAGPLTFLADGTEFNVDSSAGLLTIASSIVNSAAGANTLNLQGTASGIWNGVLVDGPTAGVDLLNVLKRGTGIWTLNGVNTYGGATTVGNGTLLINGQIAAGVVSVQAGATLGGNGIIGGAVTVAADGTIAPGASIGTLTINNNLTLASGSFTRMKFNKTAATQDQIVGVNTLTYGGTLVISNLSGTLTTSDSFKLFTAAAYAGAFASISPATPATGLAWNTSTLATDGTLRITSGVATNPTDITTAVIGGNTLQLAWPADHIGWTLEAQTNSVSVGLSTNWVRISSSASTNRVSIPIVTTNGCEFFRLVYP
jgi:autotransporter-associated beta strand protein